MLAISLIVASLADVIAGVGLAGAYALLPAIGFPLVAGLTGLALLAQGAYTLLYLSGRLDRWQPHSMYALVAGQTAAIMAGGLAALTGLLYNLHPTNGDLEFAPMSFGLLMLGQGILTLVDRSRGDRGPALPAS